MEKSHPINEATPPHETPSQTNKPFPKPRGVKRTPHEKVRSGCKTCKKRRVKCDERQPSCLRCEKFGINCDGYVLKSSKPSSDEGVNGGGSRIILPRKRGNSQSTSSSSLMEVTEVKKVRFGNEDEMRYFRLFCEKTSFHLSGYYDPVIWGKIVLQASEVEDSIRHAVISIGALDMTVLMMQELGTKNQDAREHHVFALKQYSKAIRDMRAMVLHQNEMQDLHTALVASILIICFETYHGNYRSVAQQIRTGIRLIEECKRRGEGAGTGIDEDLLRAFDRLDVQSMSHSDPFTLEEHIALKDVYTHTPHDLPEAFEDITSCRNYLNYISRRACHFASMVSKLEHSNNNIVTQQPQALLNTSPATRPDEDVVDWQTAIYEELNMFIDLTEAWMTSFQPLYTHAKAISASTPTPSALCKTVVGALAMRNHFLCMRLAFRQFKVESETTWDASLPDFREMLENAEIICAAREPLAFSFDLQSVWPLDVIAKKCRDTKMRRRAIELLKEKPRREGIWDSVVAAMVCEWIVFVEEEGMLEDGSIPECARARNICVQLNSEERNAKVWCYLPASNAHPDSNSTSKATRRKEARLEWGSKKWNRGFENNTWIHDIHQSTAIEQESLDANKPVGCSLYLGFNATKSGIGDFSFGNEVFSRMYKTRVGGFE